MCGTKHGLKAPQPSDPTLAWPEASRAQQSPPQRSTAPAPAGGRTSAAGSGSAPTPARAAHGPGAAAWGQSRRDPGKAACPPLQPKEQGHRQGRRARVTRAAEPPRAEGLAQAAPWPRSGTGTEPGARADRVTSRSPSRADRRHQASQRDRGRGQEGAGQGTNARLQEAGRLPHGLERVLGKGPKGDRDKDSLLSDELAIHGDQAEVHLEEVLEHAELLPQVALVLRVVSVDGNEQAFSKLQAEGAGISQCQGTPHLA